MTEQRTFEDVATVGELMEILEEIADAHGPDVEVMIQRDDGFCEVVSPTLTLPAEWDPYDDGTLTLNSVKEANDA